MDDVSLIEIALQARLKAYAPYSHFLVGAALLADDGTLIDGCNIENASYGATNCAERCAFFKAVSEGITKFRSIAICGGDEKESELSGYAYPCGICRQVMREFCDENEFTVIIARSTSDYKKFTLKELLPYSFGPDDLK